MKIFRDRQDAGARLARMLARFAGERPLVLALPRGGVPVACEVARALGAPLDVLVVRKLGAPFEPELGLGAAAEGGALFVDERMCAALGVTPAQIEAVAARERLEIERRVRRYRGGRPLPSLAGRTVVLVDDGVATGGTARAAIRALRSLGPAKIVFAVPVAAVPAAALLSREADVLVAVEVPEDLVAIGAWYRDFRQVGDDEVAAALARARGGNEAGGDGGAVYIDIDGVTLAGRLAVPAGATGVVLFAPGRGSSRLGPRDRYLASVLHATGLGTLLLDLLTPDEDRHDERTAEVRFDIGRLAARVVRAIDWLGRNEPALRIGCLGSGTGAAAALVAAAARPAAVAALVARAGRPDLAGDALARVRAPTLLLVGGNDPTVLALNRAALSALGCDKELAVVAGASHRFEEPGTLAQAAELTARWFAHHLAPRETTATV